MRGASGGSLETVNAATIAIISAERRVQQVTVPRRRWGACFNIYWCFGSFHRHSKRTNHAVLVPEPVFTATDVHLSDNQNHSSPLTLPFIVPPSSPASFVNSEPPSSAQSPGGFLALSTLSANASPGPASIFAIGPYAYETQLVSPPVFSTFNTEPSTAPFTPPPESVQFTTPSSPEVPFARLLSPSSDSICKKREAYELELYQSFPGSPIGHLISPSSVCSGTSSPFPDPEFHYSRKQRSILDGHIPDIMEGIDKPDASHRVSFELSAEEVAQCIERKPAMEEVMVKLDVLMNEADGNIESHVIGGSSCKLPERIESSGELVGSKEFKFRNSDENVIMEGSKEFKFRNSDENVIMDDTVPSKNWAFFPMVQSGVS